MKRIESAPRPSSTEKKEKPIRPEITAIRKELRGALQETEHRLAQIATIVPDIKGRFFIDLTAPAGNEEEKADCMARELRSRLTAFGDQLQQMLESLKIAQAKLDSYPES